MWHTVFKMENTEEAIQSYIDSVKENALLCAIGLSAWGNCAAGFGPIPDNFGMVMCLISKRLGIIGTPDSFMDWSKQFMADKDAYEADKFKNMDTFQITPDFAK